MYMCSFCKKKKVEKIVVKIKNTDVAIQLKLSTGHTKFHLCMIVMMSSRPLVDNFNNNNNSEEDCDI